MTCIHIPVTSKERSTELRTILIKLLETVLPGGAQEMDAGKKSAVRRRPETTGSKKRKNKGQPSTEMSVAEFLKDLPSQNKANFSAVVKQKEKALVTRNAQRTDDEKRIIFDKKPLLLRYLQSNWGNNPSATSSTRNGRSERKRTSDLSSSTNEESEHAEAARTKTRRRE